MPPDEPADSQGRAESLLGDVDLVAEDELQALGQTPGERRLASSPRGRRGPGLGVVLVLQAAVARR